MSPILPPTAGPPGAQPPVWHTFTAGGWIPTPSSPMQPQSFGGEDVMLVPGRLRGYRTWRVNLGMGPVPRVLTGLTARDNWLPDPMTAVCHRAGLVAAHKFSVPVGYPTDHPEGEPVPAKSCSCGFYGVHDPADYQLTVDCPCSLHARGQYGAVKGVVEGWGRVEIGQRGWRAQHVRVVALHVPEPWPRREEQVVWVQYSSTWHSYVAAASYASPPEMETREVVEICPGHAHARRLLVDGLSRTYDVPFFEHWDDLIREYPRTNLANLHPSKPQIDEDAGSP